MSETTKRGLAEVDEAPLPQEPTGDKPAGAPEGRDEAEPAAARSLDDVVARLASGYRSVGEMVYDVIKEAIVSGSFAPGERLPQETLAAAIGVSRIPVRSALIQLDAEGLVSFNPRRGAVVRSLSLEQVREIFELRQLLEVHALRKGMAHMTPARLAAMREEAARLDDVKQTADDMLERRRRFYRVLYDADANPQLVELIEGLRTKLGRYLLGHRISAGEDESHQTLVQMIADHDAEAATQWLVAHLDLVRAKMESILASRRGGGQPAGGNRSVSSAAISVS